MPRIIPARGPFKQAMLRLTLLWLLLIAPAASAAWSEPRALTGPGQDPADPRVAIARNGDPLVAWSVYDASGRTAFVADGRTIAGAGWSLAGPVTYAKSRFALAWTGAGQRRLDVLLSGARQRVDSGRRLVSPVLAGNRRGDLALAWFDDRGTSNDEVLVSVRRPGKRFGKPVRVARGRVRGVSVAVGPRGEMLVAWDAVGRVRARVLGGRTETIRSEEAFSARLETSFDGRRALVGWVAKFRSEGGDARDTFVQLAERRAGAPRFARARLLARHAGDEGSLRFDGGRYAWSTPDGIFASGGTRVAPPGARLEAFDGVVVWSLEGRLYADGEAIGGPGAADADAAVDPRTGRPTVVWTQDDRLMTSTRG